MPAWKHQKALQLDTTGLRPQHGAPQASEERQRELWATFSTSDIEAVSSKINAGSTAPAYVAGRCSSSGVVNHKPVRTALSSNHSRREPGISNASGIEAWSKRLAFRFSFILDILTWFLP